MDPFSIAAGIVGVLELSVKVSAMIFSHARASNEMKNEVKFLGLEVRSLETLFLQIEQLLPSTRGPLCDERVLEGIMLDHRATLKRLMEVPEGHEKIMSDRIVRPNLTQMDVGSHRKKWVFSASTADSAFLRSKLERLSRRFGKVLSLKTSKLLTLLSPILFAPSASAMVPDWDGHESQIYSRTRTHSQSSWSQALQSLPIDLLSPWTRPDTMTYNDNNTDPKPNLEPSTILLACFLCTSSVALVAQAGKNDPYQPYVVGFCATISAIAGAILAVDVQNFIFVYLFWGCLGGAALSVVFHRLIGVTAREQVTLSHGGVNVSGDGLALGSGDKEALWEGMTGSRRHGLEPL